MGALGSRLVQALVALPSTAAEPLLRSLAALDEATLLALGRHPAGSRALEAAFGAEGAAASRVGLVSGLARVAARLAREGCGSHVVGAAFASAPVDEKESLLSALQPHEAELRASTHGGALLRRTRFAHWKEHRASWAQHETKAAATRRAFAEFLRDDEPDGEPAAAKGRGAKGKGKGREFRSKGRGGGGRGGRGGRGRGAAAAAIGGRRRRSG